MILAQLLYIIGLLPLAYWNSVRIKNDLKIKHAYNTFYHIPAWALIVFITKEYWLLLSLPFIGKLFFDTFLYVVFRKLSWDYMPARPKSIMDKGEKFIFFNSGALAKVVYAAIILGVNIYFTWK